MCNNEEFCQSCRRAICFYISTCDAFSKHDKVLANGREDGEGSDVIKFLEIKGLIQTTEYDDMLILVKPTRKKLSLDRAEFFKFCDFKQERHRVKNP